MSEWISVKDRLPELDADNCCMDEEDYGRFSNPVLVFDEMYGDWLKAFYDGKLHQWTTADGDEDLFDVTHWMQGPESPKPQP